MCSLFSCAEGQKELSTETLEIYDVTGTENDKKPTILNYKEIKFYDGDGYLCQQDFYQVDNTLKGYEIIQRDGNKATSNYFSTDDKLLAIYNIEFDGTEMTRRVGYDGVTKEQLRSESYSYSPKGELLKKAIYNSQGSLVRTFDLSYDENLNEVGFVSYAADASSTISESYLISKVDESGRWLEKWGYTDSTPVSFHRRTFGKHLGR